MEQNKANIEADKETCKRRQCIIEHPFGTIKRQWGFNYIMTKRTKERASADVGLMFIAYNLRRLMNIKDKKAFKEFLMELCFAFPSNMILSNLKTSNLSLSIFGFAKNELFNNAA
ncbi:MAG: transposase [Sphingobacteriales bacterium]|nr:MAG: transposase [Sphingobacteriales bacterium]